jgi:hypothetical protein
MGKKKEIQVTSAGSTLTTQPERRGTPEVRAKLLNRALDIIRDIQENGATLTQACKDQGITRMQFIDYIEKDIRLVDAYARAVEYRNDLKAENIIRLAHSRTNDFYTDKDGNVRPNPVAVQRDRLIIDSEKWLLSKLAPKKYGDRIQIDAEVKHTAPLSIDQVNDILKQLDSNTIDITPEAEAE